MEYDYEPWDWEAILSHGTRIDVSDVARFHEEMIEPQEAYYESPQLITIVGTGDEEIPKSDPDLPEEFAGLPSAVKYIEGIKVDEGERKRPLDIIHLIRPLQSGHARIMDI